MILERWSDGGSLLTRLDSPNDGTKPLTLEKGETAQVYLEFARF